MHVSANAEELKSAVLTDHLWSSKCWWCWWKVYEAGQLAHGILCTIFDLCKSGIGSLGLDNNCLRVCRGLKHTSICKGVRIHFSASDTPCTFCNLCFVSFPILQFENLTWLCLVILSVDDTTHCHLFSLLILFNPLLSIWLYMPSALLSFVTLYWWWHPYRCRNVFLYKLLASVLNSNLQQYIYTCIHNAARGKCLMNCQTKPYIQEGTVISMYQKNFLSRY